MEFQLSDYIEGARDEIGEEYSNNYTSEILDHLIFFIDDRVFVEGDWDRLRSEIYRFFEENPVNYKDVRVHHTTPIQVLLSKVLKDLDGEQFRNVRMVRDNIKPERVSY